MTLTSSSFGNIGNFQHLTLIDTIFIALAFEFHRHHRLTLYWQPSAVASAPLATLLPHQHLSPPPFIADTTRIAARPLLPAPPAASRHALHCIGTSIAPHCQAAAALRRRFIRRRHAAIAIVHYFILPFIAAAVCIDARRPPITTTTRFSPPPAALPLPPLSPPLPHHPPHHNHHHHHYHHYIHCIG